MKRTITILVFFLAVISAITAQQVWHKKMPFSAINANFIGLTTDGIHYFVHSDKNFCQLDKSGTITGHFKQEQSSLFWSYATKKYAPSNGHPYFWVISRGISPPQGFTVAAYKPGIGFVNEVTFADSLGSLTWIRPQVVELNDSVFVVFGRKFFRKIKYSESAGFIEEWAKPLNIPVTAALPDNNRFIVADDSGGVTALDENGALLWSHNHAIAFRSLKKAPGGFVGCGRTLDNQAAVIRMDDDGTEIWKQVTSDKEYRDVVPTTDDGFSLTGETFDPKIILVRLDANGQQIWKKEYSNGSGARLLQYPDDGYVLAARTTAPNGQILFKTDANGNTALVENALINNRRIRTAGVQATLHPTASLFFNGNDATFIYPVDSVASILAFSPWIGGLDEGENLHLAANDYSGYISSNSDYRSGITQSPARDFNRVWATGREVINSIRQDYGTDQVLDDPVPFDLLTWPAKGNPYLRYNLDFTPVETDPSLFPAPFVDANGDGIYNVYDGDYPRIKGDQMAWWVLTDSTEHVLSGGNVIGVDMYISAYAYDCPQTELTNKSFIVDFEVLNRSATTYHDTYMGFFTDPDLGCYEDDYIGSIPGSNSYYVYNADDYDGNCLNGGNGFGSDIPVQTVTFLNRNLNHFLYFNNPAVSNPLSGTTDPDLPTEFYRYLKGFWKDGVPLTTGGSGYNPGSTAYTDHAFPDNPSDPQGWTMCAVNLPYTDRRMMASHGPFHFAPGDTFDIQVAFTLHPNIPHPCPDIFGLVQPAVSQISEWKNEGALDPAIDLDPVVDLPPGQSVVLEPGIVQSASYSWSTGETTPSITVSQPGEYSVTITLPTGCQIIESVLVQMGTSVDQPANVPVWKVQPNPAQDFITVECPDCPEGNVQVILRNAQGIVSVNLQGQSRQLWVKTQHLPPGFYWLELWQEGRFLGSKKLVVAGR